MNIKEIIIVEGKADTVAVKRATGADTIETNGSAIDGQTLSRIRRAQEVRGVIVFTDPDYPGRRIRAIIEEYIPTVKHAFLTKKQTVAKNKKSIGIEHAKDEDIRAALEAVYTVQEAPVVEIPYEMLLSAKLIGHPEARKRRDRLSELLCIGQVNGKGLKKRLEMFRIGQGKLLEALKVLDEEEEN